MSFKTTWRLLIAVMLLGAVIWVLNYTATDDSQRYIVPALLPDFRQEIHRIEINRDESRLVFEKDADGWRVTHPLRVRADAGIVRSLVALLESLPRLDTITAEQMLMRQLDWRDYGLDPAGTSLRLVAGDMDFTLQLGSLSPFGEQLFVRCGNEADVVATDAALLEYIPENLLSVINRRVFRGATHQWARIELHRESAPFLQISRNADGWVLQQPIESRASHSAIDRLLAGLGDMEIIDYVWETGADAVMPPFRDAEEFGLTQDDARFRIRIWMEGGVEPQELLLGRVPSAFPDEIYAMLEGDQSVFRVPAEIAEIVSVRAADLRDRRLFVVTRDSINRVILQTGDERVVLRADKERRWMLDEPQHEKADNEAVGKLVDGLLSLEAEFFLEADHNENNFKFVERPWLIAKLETGFSEDLYVYELLLSKPDKDGVSMAVLPSRELAARVDVAKLSLSIDKPVMPEPFVDRTIMSLYPQDIMRISLVSEDYSYEMQREDEQKSWKTSEGETVNHDLLDELLFFAAHVRATDVAALKPGDLGKFGLEKNVFEITFGLVGDKGIYRIIYIGSELSDGSGYYARVQGHETVFVLSNEVVMRITDGQLTGAGE